ncbi:hypothetical protein, partial [Paenibacillus xylaniclasticus]|uniref:hypothetical protein n=1 Tax=Paenibacillus xylaniclasticus TaxID=588083 RepID=UPI0013E0CB25
MRMKIPIKESLMKNRSNNTRLIHSLKFKLILLGTVCLVILLLVGGMSLVMLNNSNNSYDLTNQMNQINRLSEQNETLNVQYVYSKNSSYLNEISSNVEKAYNIARNNDSSGDYKDSWNQLTSLLEDNNSNMQQIIKLVGERGFDTSTGIYGKISENASLLQEQLDAIDKVGNWTDIPMLSTGNFFKGTEVINGTAYSKYRYVNKLPDKGNRDALSARIGGDSIDYKATAYITKIELLSGSEAATIDFSQNPSYVLSTSYGGALGGLEYVTFNGNPAIKVDTVFTAANNAWEEVAIKFNASAVTLSDYKQIAFEVYFDSAPPAKLSLGGAADEIYNFTSAVNQTNILFDTYNKAVIEGKLQEVNDSYNQISSLMNEMTSSFNSYFGINDKPTEAIKIMQDKIALFEQLKPLDLELAQLYNDNTALVNEMRSNISSMQESISSDMVASEERLRITMILSSVVAIAIVSVM